MITRRRLAPLAILVAAVLLALPATAQEPLPPAGSVVVVVAMSDGLTLIPVGQAVVPPLACLP